MRTNQAATIAPEYTHEGARAYPHLSVLDRLRRSVLSCLLWERGFYENGVEIAKRIFDLARSPDVSLHEVGGLAMEARSTHNLRHAPLMLLCGMLARRAGDAYVGGTVESVIQRADELTELVSLYWAINGGKRPLPAQLKRGLARAFTKFDAYQLGKYNRQTAVKLRDVLFLCHAKARSAEQDALWKQLIDGTLPTPGTWEVALSGGADKQRAWTRLLAENRLGYMAVLRNLRNMMGAGVDRDLVCQAVLARKGASRVLPFRYVAAARACPQLESTIDQALLAAIEGSPVLDGRTIVLVDVSGSMGWRMSDRSDLTGIDAAAALAALVHGDKRVFTFSNHVVEVPARPGMGGVDAILNSQPHQGTYLGGAVTQINSLPHDRLIVITDEQSYDSVPKPAAKHAYLINVASNKNGVGYGPHWTHLDGFSEGVIRWIHEGESK